MQQTHPHRVSLYPKRHGLTRVQTRLLRAALCLVAAALFGMLTLPAVSRAADLIALRYSPNAGSPPIVRSATDRAQDSFEQNARQLAAAGSDHAYQTLIQTLKEGKPSSHREITIQLLTDASPQIVPILISALNDPDAGVRAGAAEVLGLRHADNAIAALETATHDPKAQVRLQAAIALGQVNAWQDLPRLVELQVNEGNPYVRAAARAAEQMIKARIAHEIGVLESQVLAVSATTSNPPQLYAVTANDLYARHGATWKEIHSIPDIPLALATGLDANVLYLSTETSGLYRSADGGATWQPITFGPSAPTELTITAIAVSPRDSQCVYAALAVPGTATHRLDALGIAVSSDGGKSWRWLPGAPTHVVTTRLSVDPTAPGNLYGIADDTPWRYELVSFDGDQPDPSL